jgi:lipopolysaccharide export system permease protein
MAVALLHLPLVAVQVLPAAVLLSLVLTFSRLRQQGELEAMVGAGMRPARLFTPLLAVGLLGGAVALLLDETVVPRCEQAADRAAGGQVVSSLTGLVARPPRWIRHQSWLVRPGDGAAGSRLVGLRLDPSFRVTSRIDGSWSRAGEPRGRLTPLSRSSAGSNPADLSAVRSVLAGAAAVARLPRVRAEAQSYSALRLSLQQLAAAGQVQPAEELVLHTKLAYPLLNLLFALLAGALITWRRRSMLIDAALALTLLLGVWLLLGSGWIAGRVGWLSPFWGAWGPVALSFALAGILLALGPFRPSKAASHRAL